MTDDEIFIGLTTIVVLGVGAQWVARRLGFPSLLLLLPAGLLAGGVFGLVEPEELLGDTLFPAVTMLVAVLLFQSGLQLKLSELPREARRPVVRLVAIGGTITFLGASLAVLWIFDVPRNLAFLVGAIIVVSGPTVVGPLMEVARPRQPTGSILNWESTVLDPVGATLGVVILNLILASERGGTHPLLQLAGRLGLGIGVGVAAAALFVFVMSRYLLTDNMEIAVALLFAVAAFGVADVLLSEAGLFATVTLGFVVANQRVVPTARIKGFGETVEVLIIGTLFILLGALVEIEALRRYAWRTLALVVVLVLVIRPLAAGVSLIRSKLSGRQRVLISGVDPRGIVAAATAAQFAPTLSDAGFDSGFILPVVFGVILGTGIVYGLGSTPLAHWLGVRQPPSRGVGVLGNAAWLEDFAGHLHDHGVSVLVLTSDPFDAPPDAGGPPKVSIRDSERQIHEAIEAAALSQVVVSIPPGTLETLVTALLVEKLGRRQVRRLLERDDSEIGALIEEGRGAHPFAPGVTREDVDELAANGATVQVLDGAIDDALPLAAISPDGTVNLSPADRSPGPGDTVIALVGGRDAPPGA